MFNRQDGDEDLPGATAGENTPPAPAPAKQAVPAREETVAADPPKYSHSAYLTRLALQCGFSQADLDENPSSVIHAEIQALREHQRQTRQNTPAAAAGARVAAAGGGPATPPPAPVEDDPIDLIEKNPDQWDPTVIAMAKRLKSQDEKLKRLDALEQREATRTLQSLGEAIEDAFSRLPEAVVGRGHLNEQPEHIQRRRKRIYAMAQVNKDVDGPAVVRRKIEAAYKDLYEGIVAGADTVAAAYEQHGRSTAQRPAQAPGQANGQAAAKPAPPRDPETGQFVGNGNVRVLENGTRSRISDADWQQAQIARPSQRAGSAQPAGVHAAKMAVADSMRQRGIDPGVLSEEGEDSDLPG